MSTKEGSSRKCSLVQCDQTSDRIKECEKRAKKDSSWVPDCAYRLWTERRATAHAGVAVVDSNRKILVLLRAIGGNKGNWELPSGGINRNELPEDAARRELKEETNINLPNKLKLQEIKTITACNSDKTDVIVTFLACLMNNQRVVLGDEHCSWRWIKKEDMKLYRMNKATIEQLKAAFGKLR